MNLCKKCTAKPYPFLVIDTTLLSHNSSRLGNNPLERKWKKNIKKIKNRNIKIDDKIRGENV